MHISTGLLTIGTAATMYGLSSACGMSTLLMKNRPELFKGSFSDFSNKKKPIFYGLAISAIFAVQMLNFPLFGGQTSGHIAGGALLSGLIGSIPAFFGMVLVLLTQCLFFGDGGFDALGANIFNMAVLPCLIIAPLLISPAFKKEKSIGFKSMAVGVSAMISTIIGAGLVAVEALPKIGLSTFTPFLSEMLSVHAVIGVMECVVTIAMFYLILKFKNISAYATGIFAFIGAGILSSFASTLPDGLEATLENLNIETQTNNFSLLGSYGEVGIQNIIFPIFGTSFIFIATLLCLKKGNFNKL